MFGRQFLRQCKTLPVGFNSVILQIDQIYFLYFYQEIKCILHDTEYSIICLMYTLFFVYLCFDQTNTRRSDECRFIELKRNLGMVATQVCVKCIYAFIYIYIYI